MTVDTDRDPCPARGPGLQHTGLPRCDSCGQAIRDADKVPTAEAGARRSVIPAAYRTTYLRMRREGLTDRDAQALIAFTAGLLQAQGAKPWTIVELMRLQFEARYGCDCKGTVRHAVHGMELG